MFWISFIFHLILAAFLIFALGKKHSVYFSKHDRFLLFFLCLYALLGDVFQYIPYDTFTWMMLEESIVETAEAIVYLVVGIGLLAACIKEKRKLEKTVYGIYGLLFFWFVLEEFSYGLFNFNITNPGPILETLMCFRIAPGLMDFGILGAVLKILWTAMSLSLMLVMVGILLSPTLSLKIYLQPRTAWRLIKNHYLRKEGFFLLIPRFLVITLPEIGRHILPSTIGVLESESEQIGFALLALFYVFRIVLPGLSQKAKVVSFKHKNFSRMAATLWLIAWPVMLCYPMIVSIPSVVSQDKVSTEACTNPMSFSKLLAYTQSDKMVIRGLVKNDGETYLDHVELGYRLVKENNQSHKSGSFALFLNVPVNPFDPSMKQYFKHTVKTSGDFNHVEIFVKSCHEYPFEIREGRFIPHDD